jgi:hypothetical protein
MRGTCCAEEITVVHAEGDKGWELLSLVILIEGLTMGATSRDIVTTAPYGGISNILAGS